MCTFVNKFWIDDQLIQVKYEVHKFLFEDSVCWCFQCQAVSKKYGRGRNGKIVELENEPIKEITFSKKRYVKNERGKEELVYCEPPPFYHKLVTGKDSEPARRDLFG